MGQDSKIEWTDHTFNPWRGCTKVAAGCAHCYAEGQAKRNPGTLGIWGPNGSRVLASKEMWRQPVKWNAAAETSGVRERVFCASMADVFEQWDGNFPDNPPGVHGGVRCLVDAKGNRLCTRVGEEVEIQWPDESGWRPYTMYDARYRLFQLIDTTPHLDWLLLTKRPENIVEMWPCPQDPHVLGGCYHSQLRRNVWLGTSIACKADLPNIEHLRACHSHFRKMASVLFLSIEPLIEDLGTIDLEGINWVIVGGESGPDARPLHPDWVRSIVNQCFAAEVPVFFKQWGEFCPIDQIQDEAVYDAIQYHMKSGQKDTDIVRVGKAKAGRMIDGRTWSEFPLEATP